MDTQTLTPIRKRRLVAFVSLGALAAAGVALGASAFFTDTKTVEGNKIEAGTIILDASQAAATVLDVRTMLPGDAESFDLNVENGGTGELRYAIGGGFSEQAGKGNLGEHVALTVTQGGTNLYNAPGAVNTAVATTLADAKAIALVGDPAQGFQSGDRVLAPGASETITVTVTYPSASTEGAGDAADLSLLFSAEQTKNN